MRLATVCLPLGVSETRNVRLSDKLASFQVNICSCRRLVIHKNCSYLSVFLN